MIPHVASHRSAAASPQGTAAASPVYGKGSVKAAQAALRDAARRLNADAARGIGDARSRFLVLAVTQAGIADALVLFYADAIREEVTDAARGRGAGQRTDTARRQIAAAGTVVMEASDRITALQVEVAAETRNDGKAAARRFVERAAADQSMREALAQHFAALVLPACR